MSLQAVIRSAAAQHRKQFEALIGASDATLVIDTPAPKTTASGASMFADLAAPAQAPIPFGPLPCLWYDATRIPGVSDSKALDLVGRYPEAVALAMVRLSDVLVDPSNAHGMTRFDNALQVQHGGKFYEVLAFERDGIATTDPYIGMVVLAGKV